MFLPCEPDSPQVDSFVEKTILVCREHAMCQRSLHFLVVLIVGWTNLGIGEESEDQSSAIRLESAFAEREITPEIGMERPGGYGKVFHKVFHDPCKVRAVVFGDGTHRCAIVSIDALLVRRMLVEGARKRIEERTGIQPEAILIHATHSHSSGPTGMIYPGEYDHASSDVQDLAYNKSSTANLEYVHHVENQIVDAVIEADSKRSPSTCCVGSGIEDQVAFNRRFLMSSGLTQTHPRAGNPGIVEVAGPTDPEVGVVGLWDAKGDLKGCIVNFSCHATASAPGISANYIYYVEQVIRGTFGKDCILVFLAGASGDVTQVENVTDNAGRPPEESSRFVGGRVGAEAVKVLLSLPRSDAMNVAFQSRLLEIPRRAPSAEHVDRAKQIVAQGPDEMGRTVWAFAKETVMLNARLKAHPVAEVEIQAIQIGPAIFLTNPAEFFCQLGLDIKKESPFRFTFPVSLTNGCVGYVPTEEAFGRHGGGYETRLTSYSNLEITAGRQIVEAAIELSKTMTPGHVPTRPPAATFRKNAWDYGTVPPQLD